MIYKAVPMSINRGGRKTLRLECGGIRAISISVKDLSEWCVVSRYPSAHAHDDSCIEFGVAVVDINGATSVVLAG